MIEPSHSYFSALRSEINRRLVGASHAQRAVLVFFASQAQLQDFHNAPEMVDLCDTVRTMTKETSAQEKDTVVRQAVIPGSVTLLTREYGYGTDFMCFDDRLISAGGVHVIQTFLSDCLSEEIHIKGRTARQVASPSPSPLPASAHKITQRWYTGGSGRRKTSCMTGISHTHFTHFTHWRAREVRHWPHRWRHVFVYLSFLAAALLMRLVTRHRAHGL